MKKLLICAIFSICASFVQAAPQSVGPPWGGLNTSAPSIFIGDNEAQDLLNVDIGEGGLSIKKRAFECFYTSMTITTAPVRGSFYFRSVAGQDTVIFANDKRIYRGVDTGSPFSYSFSFSTIVTTETFGGFYDFEASNGILWRANSNKDEILSYNGTAVTYYPNSPKGNQIEIMPDRLVISGAVGNDIRFSAAGDFTNFVNGIEETSPFTETVGLPSQNVLAIKYAHGRIYIWSKSAFYFWEGTDQFNAIIQNISNDVGIGTSQSVIFKDNVLFWQAANGYFYSFDGAEMRRISRKVDDPNALYDTYITTAPAWVVSDSRDRIIWAQATIGSTFTSRSMIYDIPNGGAWLKYDFAMDAPVKFNNDTIFYARKTGGIGQYITGNSACGNDSPPTAYWKSKDFISGNPYVEKDYKSISLIALAASSAQQFSVQYKINTRDDVGGTAGFTVQISTAYNNSESYSRINQRFPVGKMGTFINFRIGDSGGPEYWSVYSLSYEYEPRLWRPLP